MVNFHKLYIFSMSSHFLLTWVSPGGSDMVQSSGNFETTSPEFGEQTTILEIESVTMDTAVTCSIPSSRIIEVPVLARGNVS